MHIYKQRNYYICNSDSATVYICWLKQVFVKLYVVAALWQTVTSKFEENVSE